MQNKEAFTQLLATPKKCVVITHFKPDADAMGSSLGWGRFLEKKGHDVAVVAPSDYPDFLAWMPGNEKVVTVKNEETKEKAIQLIKAAEIIFCLDFSALQRIYELGKTVAEAKGIKVVIDHHLEPEKFPDYLFWDAKSASTAGLIFELIGICDGKDFLDAEIATCLYAGLMADTGGFRHSNTRSHEFEMAARLVKLGANPHSVTRQIMDNNSLERIRFMGFVLKDKLTVLPEYRTAYIALPADEVKQYKVMTGDTEGLVNYGLSVKGVVLSVLFFDRKDEIKLSFRSTGNFSVNDLARKYFNGGGHANAAGGSSRASLDETLQKFLAILPGLKEELIKINL